MAREKVVIQNERQQDVNPITVTSAIHANDEGKSPFVTKTNEDAQVAIDSDGTLWYRKGGGGSGGGASDAEEVRFSKDLVTTTPIGYIEVGESGQAIIPAKNKNLVEVFNSIFVKETNPTIEQPSVTSIGAVGCKGYEVGEIANVSYGLSVSVGSYSYGPATGVKAEGYFVSFGGETLTAKSGAFKPYTVSQEGNNVRIEAYIKHSDGTIPVTNVGNPYPQGQIKKGNSEIATSAYVTGYRSSFVYVGTDCSTTIDSAFIRGSTNKHANTKNFGTVIIPEGTKRIMFAVPGKATLTSCIDVDGMGLDVVGNFKTIPVNVEGANRFSPIEYTVFYTENVNGLAATKYTPKIK